MRHSRTPLVIALLLCIPALRSGAAQDGTPSTSSPQSASGPSASPAQGAAGSAAMLQVYSRETDVDVLVTDAQGQPVYGLSKSDFSVEEDGKPQAIESFQEFGDATASPALLRRDASPGRSAADLSGLLPEARTLPPNVYTNFEATPVSGPVNIILFDTFSSGPPLIDYAEEQTNEYFRTMPQGTEVAVFWLSGGGLHMLQGFTSDRELLLKATKTDRTDFGSYDIRWTRNWLTIDALDQLAAYVSGIKGRKNLIWFTPTMPVMPTRDGGYGWPGDREYGIDMGLVHRLMDTYDLYSAEQIAICPIDPHGVHRIGPAQLRMQTVAKGTGGVAYYNGNDLRASVSHAIADGSHFYTLAYIPPAHANDSRYRTIDVKVDRPGLHLVYRGGYNAEDPPPHAAAAGDDLMAASLEGKVPAVTQILFDASVQPAKAWTASSASPATPSTAKVRVAPTTYDVLYALPQSQIALAEGLDGMHTGTLKFALSAYNIDGKLMARFDQNVRLDLTGDQYRQFVKNPLEFHEQFSLPPGQYSVHLGVLDTVSNNVGTMEISLFNRQAIHSVLRLHGR